MKNNIPIPASSFPNASGVRAAGAVLLAAAFCLGLLLAPARAAEVGTIAGTVSNTASGNLLEGAKVAVPQLGLVAYTDDTGLYHLGNVPVGTYELVATYIGLDALRATVTVTPGQRAVRNFDLTTGIYQMQEFRVTGEREGGAAALTLQRNADNVKNIVAMDSYGNLPNMNAAEVAIRLPGVVGNLATRTWWTVSRSAASGPGSTPSPSTVRR